MDGYNPIMFTRRETPSGSAFRGTALIVGAEKGGGD